MTTVKEELDTCDLQPTLTPTVDHNRDDVFNNVKPSIAELPISTAELWKQEDLSSFPSISNANKSIGTGSIGNAGGNVENSLSFESSPFPVLFIKNRATTNTCEPIFHGKQINSDENCLEKRPDNAIQPSETEAEEMGLNQPHGGRVVGHLDIKTVNSDKFVPGQSVRVAGYLDTVSYDKSCRKMEDSIVTDCDPDDCNLITSKPSALSQNLSTCEEPKLDDKVNYGDSDAKHLDISSQRHRRRSRQTKFKKNDDAQTQTMSVKDVYACPLCKMAFSSNQYLENHMKRMHNEKNQKNVKDSIGKKSSAVGFNCFENDNHTLSKSVNCCTDEKRGMEAVKQVNDCLIKDEQPTMSEGEESFKSGGSGQKASQNIKLYSNATQQGEGFVQCSECGKMFSQESDHIKNMEKTNERIVLRCYECYSLSMLRDFHQEQHIEQSLPHNEYYNMLGQYSCHQGQMRPHTGEKLFECGECGRTFSQSSHIRSHMRSHTGEKPFKCNECGKTFSLSNHLHRHMRTHTGEKPFECNECGKTFSQSEDIHRHMRTHTGEKPFKCIECGKTFSQNGDLHRHMRTHTGKKLFKCTECGKTFGRNDGLNAHMRIHTGEKPFKCKECGKTFNHSGHLRSHMKTH